MGDAVTPYYQDDLVTLYHGDCREVLPLLSFDLIVTDPPYGIGWTRSENKARNSKPHEGIEGDEDVSARDMVLTLANGRPCVSFGSFYAPFPLGLKHLLVWQKPPDAGVVGATTGYRRDVEAIFLTGEWPPRPVEWSSLIRSATGGIAALVSTTGHPHTKPVDLLMLLIDRSPSGIVADPFCGSGSTLVASKRLGRTAIGIELDERYCEVAANRIRQGTLAEMFQ